jgi:two-component system osmolarity sensor histidine kinase EnvZ
MIHLRPFKLLKRFLPKTLYGRALIILIAPVVLIQLIITYVFIDRHLSNVTKTLADNIAGNVAAVTKLMEPPASSEKTFEEIQRISFLHFNASLQVIPPRSLLSSKTTPIGWTENFLYDALESRLSSPFIIQMGEPYILIEVETPEKNLIFKTQTKFLFSKTTPILLWWALGTPILFLLIAVVFMRNQIRPLKKLAVVVTEFGKGREVKNFKPSGAYEVRKVGKAFNAMKERIQRQIKQRTEMLAGVSHDLRTPLTRMSLELAMLKDSPAIKNLQSDIKEMTKMIEEYLAFSKGEDGEPLKMTNIATLLSTLSKMYPKKSIAFKKLKDSHELCVLPARPHALSRCFTNLLNNAVKYSSHVWVHLERQPKRLKIYIDDNGPGIPEAQRKDVFKPFFRLDESRNPQTGGSGLGLAIAKDIIHSHGGRIILDDSPKGGLRVIVSLPL